MAARTGPDPQARPHDARGSGGGRLRPLRDHLVELPPAARSPLRNIPSRRRPPQPPAPLRKLRLGPRRPHPNATAVIRNAPYSRKNDLSEQLNLMTEVAHDPWLLQESRVSRRLEHRRFDLEVGIARQDGE